MTAAANTPAKATKAKSAPAAKSKPTAAQKAGFPASPAPAKKATAKKAAAPAADKAAPAPRKRAVSAKRAIPAPAAEAQGPQGDAAPVVTPENHINAALADAATTPVEVLSKAAMAFGAAALSALGNTDRPGRAGDAVGGRRATDNADGAQDDTTGTQGGNTGTTTKGTKVQKERPTQNGVTRQSPGSVGDKLWTAYDNHGGNPTLVEARALAKSLKLNETSASLALYQWRKFHGLGKTEQAAPAPAAQ